MDERVVVLVVTENPHTPDEDAAAVAAEIREHFDGVAPVEVRFIPPEGVDPAQAVP